MKIVIGSHMTGLELKNAIIKWLKENGHEVEDTGVYDMEDMTSYVPVAKAVAERVQDGRAERGIVLCGTGMGVSIVSNKHKGIRAALVESVHTARTCRMVNDANVLCLGGSLLGAVLAIEMVETFLTTEFGTGFAAPIKEPLREELGLLSDLEDKNFK